MSPLLSNIVADELDKKVRALISRKRGKSLWQVIR